MTYRENWQWQKICENAANGNWKDAAKNCVEFGFYANDMIEKYEEEEIHLIEAIDLAILAEIAAEIRGQK